MTTATSSSRKKEITFAGQQRIIERKARICMRCDTEIAATFLVCHFCEQAPDGRESAALQEQMLSPRSCESEGRSERSGLTEAIVRLPDNSATTTDAAPLETGGPQGVQRCRRSLGQRRQGRLRRPLDRDGKRMDGRVHRRNRSHRKRSRSTGAIRRPGTEWV